MKNEKDIRKEVDQALNSLDGIQRATANPYLFTRVKAGLEKGERNFWSNALTIMSRPAVVFTTLVIALFVNAILFFEFKSEPIQSSGEEEQLFANEYNLTDNTIYDSTIETQ